MASKKVVASEGTLPSSVIKAEIKSNKPSGKTASLVNGFVQLYYHESILQDSIKVDYIFKEPEIKFHLNTLDLPHLHI